MMQGIGGIRDSSSRVETVPNIESLEIQHEHKDREDAFVPSEKEVAAARLIQNQIRASLLTKRVRCNTLMPLQLYYFIEQNLGKLLTENRRRANLQELAWTIAREVTNHLQNTSVSDQVAVRANAQTPHNFPVFSERNTFEETHIAHLPLSIWVQRHSPEQVEVELISERIGSGSFKKVFKSVVLTIDTSTTPYTISSDFAALSRFPLGVGDVNLLEGISVLKMHFEPRELKNPQFRIAGNLTHVRKFDHKAEARDVFCEGDILQLCDGLNLSERISVFSDVANTLSQLHYKGLVHSDVKPENILVRSKRGYLTDLDFLKTIGPCTGATLGYCDALMQSGVSTPFHDIYALAMTVALLVFDLDNIDLPAREMRSRLIRTFNAWPSDKRKRYALLLKAILQVTSANQNSASFMREQGLNKTLLYGKRDEKREAMLKLSMRFPEFHQFLETLIRFPNKPRANSR